MIAKKVIRYYSDCGRGFWKKSTALTHDKNCKCWKNPKYKTCLSCKLKDIRNDNNGMGLAPQNFQTWNINECKHSEKVAAVHKDFEHIKMYCPFYELK